MFVPADGVGSLLFLPAASPMPRMDRHQEVFMALHKFDSHSSCIFIEAAHEFVGQSKNKCKKIFCRNRNLFFFYGKHGMIDILSNAPEQICFGMQTHF